MNRIKDGKVMITICLGYSFNLALRLRIEKAFREILSRLMAGALPAQCMIQYEVQTCYRHDLGAQP